MAFSTADNLFLYHGQNGKSEAFDPSADPSLVLYGLDYPELFVVWTSSTERHVTQPLTSTPSRMRNNQEAGIVASTSPYIVTP